MELASVAELKRQCKSAGYRTIQINDSEIIATYQGERPEPSFYEIASALKIRCLAGGGFSVPGCHSFACGVVFPDGSHGGNEFVDFHEASEESMMRV